MDDVGLTLGGGGIGAGIAGIAGMNLASMMRDEYENDDDLSTARVLQLKPPKWRKNHDAEAKGEDAFGQDSSDEYVFLVRLRRLTRE